VIGNYITERRAEMGIASGMETLVQDIASSHEDRAKRLGEIKEEASQTREEAKDLIKGFQASRKELKAELKEASAAWQSRKSAKNRKQRKED
jgi:hypothetical protein